MALTDYDRLGPIEGFQGLNLDSGLLLDMMFHENRDKKKVVSRVIKQPGDFVKKNKLVVKKEHITSPSETKIKESLLSTLKQSLKDTTEIASTNDDTSENKAGVNSRNNINLKVLEESIQFAPKPKHRTSCLPSPTKICES